MNMRRYGRSQPTKPGGTTPNQRGHEEPLRTSVCDLQARADAEEEESPGSNDQENRDPNASTEERTVLNRVDEGENRPRHLPDKQSGPGRRVRAWCFTSFALDRGSRLDRSRTDGLEVFEQAVRYIVFQEEEGTGTHRRHYQGYVEFFRSVRLNDVKRIIDPGAHCEPRRGTQAEAVAYCQKEPRIAGPWAFGTPSLGPGTRTDIACFRDAICNGSNKAQLIEDYPSLIARFPRFYYTVKSVTRPKRTVDFKVTLLFGDAGTGKTRHVWDKWEDKGFWSLPIVTSQLWFDGYDGESCVLLDDFSGASSRVTLAVTLQILDRYPIQVPIKGGFVWWAPKRIAVTTNVHPNDWYKWEGRTSSYKALRRRFHEIYVFEEGSESPYLANNALFMDLL